MTWLRTHGWRCDISERFNPHAGPHGKRSDLFGFADLMAFRFDRPGAMAVQYTSSHNLPARICKTLLLDTAHEWVAAGNRLLFVGWKKVSGRWVAQTREITRR